MLDSTTPRQQHVKECSTKRNTGLSLFYKRIVIKNEKPDMSDFQLHKHWKTKVRKTKYTQAKSST